MQTFDVFRSHRMRLCQIVIHRDTGFDCILELGYLGKAEFVFENDDHPDLDEEYANNVDRSNKLLQIIYRFQKELNTLGVDTAFDPNVDNEHKPHLGDLSKIEEILMKLNAEFKESMLMSKNLNRKWIQVEERRKVLSMANRILSGPSPQVILTDTLLKNILQNHPQGLSEEDALQALTPLSFIVGTVPIQNFSAFEVMVWRVSRGNAITKHELIELPSYLEETTSLVHYKYAFMLIFFGDQLFPQLSKVCGGFGAKVFKFPASTTERSQQINALDAELVDIKEIDAQTLERRKFVLSETASELYIWRSKLIRIKAVYSVLSRLDKIRHKNSHRYLLAECWVPKKEIFKVRKALLSGARAAGDHSTKNMVFPPMLNIVQNIAKLQQPTLFHTNKYTKVFQDMVDTYGIASYRELNPAPFYVITFPFFFGIMFADLGHGLILFVMAIWLIIHEKKYDKYLIEREKSNFVYDFLYNGRYLILLMGIFSIYAGIIFNSFFAKSMNIFGSSWNVNYTNADVMGNHILQLDPARLDHYKGYPYIIGLDPIWDSTTANHINIITSLKMKASIIVGVVHLLFALCLSGANSVFFRDKTSLYLIFAPQLVFLCSVFVYLVVMIFQKWFCFGGHKTNQFIPHCAPSLFYTFLNMLMFLKPQNIPPGCSKYIYNYQDELEITLALIAIASVFVLLLGYPIHYLFKYHKEKIRNLRRTINVGILRRLSTVESHFQRESVIIVERSSMTDVFLSQFIKTFEAIMGIISHTASYFRLWAVSLAHGQLSIILYRSILHIALTSNYGYLSSILICVGVALFAIMTFFFLVVLGGLAAFMHTLRLHWLEFQTKFYGANGTAFTPLYFEPSKRTDAET